MTPETFLEVKRKNHIQAAINDIKVIIVIMDINVISVIILI